MEALALPEPVDPTLTLDIPHVDRLALPRKEQAQSPDSTGSGVSTQGVLSANEADQPPRELSNAQPIYPRLARRRGAEGQVDLHLLIDDSGRVQRLEVARVVGHESFRNAVLEAARCWRFSPALRDGVPVSVWADKSIHFEID
jgi:TonB family protein